MIAACPSAASPDRGTLGLLIPPSIIMIVYGVSADVSIIRLFLAGIIPGLMLMALFMGYIVVAALVRKGVAPVDAVKTTFAEKLRLSKGLIPVVLLIGAVIGSIYAGIATATEAAAGGVIGALLLAVATGSLSWAMFRESLLSATRLSCMIFMILSGAAFLTTSLAYTGIPAAVAEWVAALDLHPYALMAALCVLYVVLGCFIEGISMIVLTATVVLPLVTQAGFDLLWFGVFIIMVVETAQITPPLGFNLFVIQGPDGTQHRTGRRFRRAVLRPAARRHRSHNGVSRIGHVAAVDAGLTAPQSARCDD